MNAIRYYRILNGYTLAEVCRRTGITSGTISNLEKMGRESGVGGVDPKHYIKLARLFGVTIDELLREDLPELPEQPVRRHEIGTRNECLTNPLVVYRKEHHLNLRQVAEILGVSHQHVSNVCARPQPPDEFIQILAGRDGISVEVFLGTYGGVI